MSAGFEDKVTELLELLNQATGAVRTTLRIPTPEGGGLRIVASSGRDNSPLPLVRTALDDATVVAFRTGEVVVNNDYASRRLAEPKAIELGVRSLVSFPVISGGQTLGVINITSEETEFFTPQLTSVLNAYVFALGALLESFTTSQRLQKLVRDREVDVEIGRIVNSNLAINEVYERFAAQVKKVVDFDRITISTIDEFDKSFEIA